MRKFTALIILGLILSSSVSGQVPNFSKIPNKEGNEQPVPSKTPSGIHELTAQDLETFLDGIVPLQLEREDFAGATLDRYSPYTPPSAPTLGSAKEDATWRHGLLRSKLRSGFICTS